VEEIWIEIKLWIDRNAPHLLNYLGHPASIKDLQDVEDKLGIKFSDGFKEFYMVHNGQVDESECIIYEHAILPLERIVGEWEAWTDLLNKGAFMCNGVNATSDPDPGIKNDWWNTKWIPVTSDGCGDSFCVDMDPGNVGRAGQIISMRHDSGWRELKSNSFEDWIIQYANDLKQGLYIYEERLGIWKKNEN
jgi:cell wall assembly regulator SMI1